MKIIRRYRLGHAEKGSDLLKVIQILEKAEAESEQKLDCSYVLPCILYPHVLAPALQNWV